MFSAELKERTWKVHAEVEKKLVAKIKEVRSTADYVGLLKLMYGFYFPLQQQLRPFLAHLPSATNLRGRQAESILSDIAYFQQGNETPPALSKQLPDINSYHSSLGALYVSEGSTLGGRIIAGMIGRQLALDTCEGFSFFNAYGEQTKAMWEEFKQLLDLPMTEEERETVVTSATDTFSSFKIWMTQHESSNVK